MASISLLDSRRVDKWEARSSVEVVEDSLSLRAVCSATVPTEEWNLESGGGRFWMLATAEMMAYEA